MSDDHGGSTTQAATALVSGAGINGRVLQIVGTAGKDKVEVHAQGRNNEWIEVKVGFLSDKGHTRIFKEADFDSIVIMVGDGNDHVTVDKKIAKPVTIDGGAGGDHLMAGGGSATLLGGNGNDVLFGGLRNDVLIGGDGNDRLYGGCGDDEMSGGNGNDLLVGGPGNDNLDDGPGKNRLIDRAVKYKDCHAPQNGTFHNTQVSPCGPWVKNFVIGLAGSNDTHHLNSSIQIVFPPANNKPKIDSKGCKR